MKVIEARALLTATDATGGTFKGVVDKINAIAKAQSAFAKSGAKELGLYAKHVDRMNDKIGSIEHFKRQHQALKESRMQFRAAQDDVIRLGRAMKDTANPTREMTREYERAQRTVRASATAFQDKVSAVKAARSEMAGYGVTLANINRQHGAALRAIGRQPAGAGLGPPVPAHLPGAVRTVAPPHAKAPHAPQEGGSGMPPVVAAPLRYLGPAALGYGAYRLHGAIVDKHHDFQAAYLYQQAVLGMDAEKQKPLLNQAVRIGQDTKFTNADIVKAQTDIGAKLPKDLQTPETIAAITEHTKNYALAMKVSMEEASVAMVGWMKARGYDLSSPQAAEKSARRTANQMVEFAKTTGAKHHDLVGDTKFGAAPGKAGGFSEEFSNALSAQLIRIGYEGAMAGTFVRAAAMRLSAPTRKAHAAIATAGLNFDDYVKPGVNVGKGGLEKMLQQRFGRSLNKDQSAKLDAVFDDPEVVSDRGKFIEAASEILNSTFAKKDKKGRVNAMDAERIAKTLAEFHTLSAGGVDSERLMTDLVKKGMSPAVAQYLFGDKQGGRAIAIDPDRLQKDIENFKNVPEDRASSVAKKMQEGPQGEYTKMVGSFETFITALGEATGGVREFGYNLTGNFFDGLTSLISGRFSALEQHVANRGRVAGQIDPADLEAARRAQDNFRRNPEGARAEAFARIGQGENITAKVESPVPVDVTGKVALDPASKVDVNVSVKVQGQATVTGQSVTAGGNAKGSVGTSTAGNYDTP